MFFLRKGGGCTQANKFLKSYEELSLAVMEQFCMLVKTRLRITAVDEGWVPIALVTF